MKNVESSMDWMSFSNKMKQVACQISSSACPMVLVLPDGREIRFTDINVDTFDYKGKRGDTEYTSIGFKVNLLGAEVRNGKDDGSLANSPHGNMTKMREALVNISKYADCAAMRQHDTTTQHYIEQIRKWADAALAAPPRNCDVGTVDEQTERFADFARLAFQSEVVRCAMNWAQMPYEEGGAK